MRVGDIFNIRSDKLGHSTAIRSDLTTSAEGLCCLLTKVLKHDLQSTGLQSVIVNWIKDREGRTEDGDSEAFFKKKDIGRISVY